MVKLSVPLGDRDTAEPEYIQNLRQLVLYTLEKTRKWPIRVDRDLGERLKNAVWFVFERAHDGRNVWPTNADEAQIRRIAFLEARARLRGFVAMLEIAAEDFPECKKYLPAWSAMAAREIKLLSGVLESDRKRFRF